MALLKNEERKSDSSLDHKHGLEELIVFLSPAGAPSRTAACEEAIRQFPVLLGLYTNDPEAELTTWEAIRARVLAAIAVELRHFIEPVDRSIFFRVPEELTQKPALKPE